MRITIRDVAKKAKVSTATVSLVIHGNDRISKLTRNRVLKAIEELNYYPSRSARDLVSRKSGNIGFVITEDHFLKTEPFYTKIFLGCEFEARKHPYYVLLATINRDYSQDDPLPRFILENSVDGIIIAGSVPDAFITNLQRYNLPTVYIDYYPEEGEHAAVLIDNLNGAKAAIQHLIDCGHKDIGFIGGDLRHPSIRDRFQGYRMTLEMNGITYRESNAIIDEKIISRENGYRATERLLAKNKNITAVFACNDAMAIGAMQYLKEKKLRIPKDVSLIGFDDIESDVFLEPPLTTLSVPKMDMGSEALRLISDIIDRGENSPKKVLMPVELVIRKSTCEHK